MNYVIDAIHQRSLPTPSRYAMCQNVECHLLVLILQFLMPPLLNVGAWHRLGRPSGVDHTNGREGE